MHPQLCTLSTLMRTMRRPSLRTCRPDTMNTCLGPMMQHSYLRCRTCKKGSQRQQRQHRLHKVCMFLHRRLKTNRHHKMRTSSWMLQTLNSRQCRKGTERPAAARQHSNSPPHRRPAARRRRRGTRKSCWLEACAARLGRRGAAARRSESGSLSRQRATFRRVIAQSRQSHSARCKRRRRPPPTRSRRRDRRSCSRPRTRQTG